MYKEKALKAGFKLEEAFVIRFQSKPGRGACIGIHL